MLYYKKNYCMKLLFLLLMPAFVWSQNTLSTTNKQTLLLNYKQSVNIGDVSLKFEKVLSDSRCPTDVNCVWAGEAIVIIVVSTKGEDVYYKEVIIDASGTLSDFNNLIFDSDTNKVFLSRILPYPKTSEEKDFDKYYLEILVQSFQ